MWPRPLERTPPIRPWNAKEKRFSDVASTKSSAAFKKSEPGISAARFPNSGYRARVYGMLRKMAEQEQGVLLYYKFVTLPNPEATRQWFEDVCSSLSLLGRVRIARTGINVTVGGSMESLRLHIKALEEQELFRGCDFKLATCLHPMDERVAADCGFDSLSVRLVKEIVTLGVHPSPSLLDAGKHLSPKKFHEMLEEGSSGNARDNEAKNKQRGMAVLDARNIYETRIGKFCPPPGVEFFDPKIRQYGDLPDWIDQHADELHNKSILMYCTGGVRCEMASAYVRSKGEGFRDVFQLSGGIQRYLEAFPEGGYFQGKNFVFDHRISVPSTRQAVIGCCLACGSSYDDYSSRSRCSLCRMLVLICDSCQASKPYVCELCQNNIKADQKLIALPSVSSTSEQAKTAGKKKLRVLCLHGFRQNASNMKGRMASLAKKLKSMVEFVFVDAPHELPFIYQLRVENLSSRPEVEGSTSDVVMPQTGNKKYAWLVDPETYSVEGTDSWVLAKEAFDSMQYKSQTSGWRESWAYLQNVFGESGPFDGVLGFSQGAAVAAALAPLRNSGSLDFKFVILCSGFLSPAFQAQDSGVVIQCPSLHIFCDAGHDRQIRSLESEKLASKFSAESRVVIRHSSGHMVPTQPEYLEQYSRFLSQFL